MTGDMRMQDLRWTAAGAGAAFIGVGLARFAYNPLFPAMVEAGWIEASGGAWLGAINLAGYLVGVLGSTFAVRALGLARTFNLAAGVTFVSILACAWNAGLIWFCLWRGLAGIGGGVLMGIAGPAVQAVVSPRVRGLAGGGVIAGIGAGIILGALVVPPLLSAGLAIAWCLIAVIVLLLWALAFRSWPAVGAAPTAVLKPSSGIRLVAVVYGLSGAGMIPHMVFLSDLAVRGYHFPPHTASAAWAIFGLGAIVGTLSGGRIADWLGGRRAIQCWLVLQVIAVSLLALPSPYALIVAGFSGGAAGIGLTAVILAYVREMDEGRAARNWCLITAIYGICQASGASVLAMVFTGSGTHGPVLVAGWMLSALALALAAALPRRSRA